MIRLLQGDCRETLRTLEAGSVQSCITSPPYYGLRDYGTEPLVWGGDAEHAHNFEDLGRRSKGGINSNRGLDRWDGSDRSASQAAVATQQYAPKGSSCRCGAWLGSLGLEPTPELFIEHLVECLREVKRVIRDDGTLWVNMGDSYAGSGKGPSNEGSKQKTNAGSLITNHGGFQSSASQIGPSAIKKRNPEQFANGQAPTAIVSVPDGMKPKDLMMMPFRVAMALQADGWYLRSVIPWLKRNSMPESVTDRPSTSVEYVFLLAKKPRYYWDADAARMPAEYGRRDRSNVDGNMAAVTGARAVGATATARAQATVSGKHPETGRNLRNGDLFFQTWQGLLLDEDDDPLALVVNPQPFKGSHFATFPPKLVEPMVKASTRAGDTVLDCFGGSGTVGLVADRFGRDAVLCELKPDYAEMGSSRIIGDAPMFAEVEASA